MCFIVSAINWNVICHQHISLLWEGILCKYRFVFKISNWQCEVFVCKLVYSCLPIGLFEVAISVRQILKFSSSMWTKKGFPNTNSNYCKVLCCVSKNCCSLYFWLKLIVSHSRFKFVFITCPIPESNIAKAAKWLNIYSKCAFTLDCSRTRNNFSVPSFSVVGFENENFIEYTEILGLPSYLSEVSYKACVGFLLCSSILSRF